MINQIHLKTSGRVGGGYNRSIFCLQVDGSITGRGYIQQFMVFNQCTAFLRQNSFLIQILEHYFILTCNLPKTPHILQVVNNNYSFEPCLVQ